MGEEDLSEINGQHSDMSWTNPVYYFATEAPGSLLSTRHLPAYLLLV